MNLEIEGRTALVLGAGGGLGSAIATTLSSEGVKVALADLTTENLVPVADAIALSGGQVTSLAWDLSDRELIDAKIRMIEAELGGVDILVNNTGGPPPTSAHGQSPELWEKYFQSMVLSVIAITDRVLPGMRSRHWGRIVTSTSSGIVAPIPNRFCRKLSCDAPKTVELFYSTTYAA